MIKPWLKDIVHSQNCSFLSILRWSFGRCVSLYHFLHSFNVVLFLKFFCAPTQAECFEARLLVNWHRLMTTQVPVDHFWLLWRLHSSKLFLKTIPFHNPHPLQLAYSPWSAASEEDFHCLCLINFQFDSKEHRRSTQIAASFQWPWQVYERSLHTICLATFMSRNNAFQNAHREFDRKWHPINQRLRLTPHCVHP